MLAGRTGISFGPKEAAPTMADTTFLKDVVEPYVREWLAKNFGRPFQRSSFL